MQRNRSTSLQQHDVAFIHPPDCALSILLVLNSRGSCCFMRNDVHLDYGSSLLLQFPSSSELYCDCLLILVSACARDFVEMLIHRHGPPTYRRPSGFPTTIRGYVVSIVVPAIYASISPCAALFSFGAGLSVSSQNFSPRILTFFFPVGMTLRILN